MMKMKKLFLMSFCIVALSAMIFYQQSSAFARALDRKPDINVFKGANCDIKENKFRARQFVSMEASHVVVAAPPNNFANIYVVPD